MPVYSDNAKEMIRWILYDRSPANITEFDDPGNGEKGFQNLLRSGNVLTFFQDIQRKTKLETNMDTSGMLSRNSFDVHALRVVIAPLGGEEEEVEETEPPPPDSGGGSGQKTRVSAGRKAADDPLEEDDDDDLPHIIEEFIYNSVTTLQVGDKKYIEAPTFNFPAAAGPFGGNGSSGASHGEPNPKSTFSFGEPIRIPALQSFAVQISFPRGIDHLTYLPDANVGVWVELDGMLTRDVM